LIIFIRCSLFLRGTRKGGIIGAISLISPKESELSNISKKSSSIDIIESNNNPLLRIDDNEFVYSIRESNRDNKTLNEIKDIIQCIVDFIVNNMDMILNMSLLLSCILLFISLPRVIRIYIKKKKNKEIIVEKWINDFKLVFWALFFTIFLFFFFDYIYPDIFPYSTTSYISKRILKFILVIILNLSSMYININTVGLKSWRTYLSIIAFISTIFVIMVFFSPTVRNLFGTAVINGAHLLIGLWQTHLLYDMGIGMPNLSSNVIENEKGKYITIRNIEKSKKSEDKFIRKERSDNNSRFYGYRVEKRKENHILEKIENRRKQDNLYKNKKERLDERKQKQKSKVVKFVDQKGIESSEWEKKKKGIKL